MEWVSLPSKFSPSIASLYFWQGMQLDLPFLEVLVEKNDHLFVTSIYRKSTFTGQYIRWNSFCLMKRKISLISTHVHRASVTCSESTLQNELCDIRTILINNGYPKWPHKVVINIAITRKMNQFRRPAQLGKKKCPVYLYFTCRIMSRWGTKCRLKLCYFAVKPCIVYTTRKLLPAA